VGVFQKKVLRENKHVNIEELHSEQLLNLYYSCYIIKVIKSRKRQQARKIEFMWKAEAYMFVKKSSGKRQF
jgi:hypothetical protein